MTAIISPVLQRWMDEGYTDAFVFENHYVVSQTDHNRRYPTRSIHFTIEHCPESRVLVYTFSTSTTLCYALYTDTDEETE